MNLAIPLNAFNLAHIIFLDKKKNVVLDNGLFVKILYSTADITINGLYLAVDLKIFKILSPPHNNIPRTVTTYQKKVKYICNLENSQENNIVLNRIYEIEKQILDNYKDNYNVEKENIYIINNSFNNNSIKIYDRVNKNNGQFIFKISGIWENATQIGLTYKIDVINNVIDNVNTHIYHQHYVASYNNIPPPLINRRSYSFCK